MIGHVTRLERLLAAAGTKQRLIAPAIARICIGSITAILYALHISQRNVIWGPDAVVTWRDAHAIVAPESGWSLFGLVHDQLGFEALFWTGFIVTIAYTLGLGSRVGSFLFVLFTWSLYQRNYYAIDGGENLLIIISIYLMFADTSAISLDRKLGWVRPGGGSWLVGLVHNAAIVACLLQLAILYFVSDFFKIQGHVWADGTALYYVLRTNEFAAPVWAQALVRNDVFVTVGTYLTILFEAMYPWAIWHRQLKYAVVVGVILLHGGIAIFMGLVWFSATMISLDILFFDDPELLAVQAAYVRLTCVVRQLLLTLGERRRAEEVVS